MRTNWTNPMPNLTTHELIARIKAAREAKGLSQLEASALAGIKPPMWSMAETGAREPSEAVLVKMAGAVGIRASRLWVTSRAASTASTK